MEVPVPPTLHTSVAHPFTSSYPPPPAPTAVPLPPATFLSSEQVLPTPPPISIPVPATAYTGPPPMVFQAPSAPAATHLQATELPPYPSLQPHVGLSYQAPPPINTTFHEPGTPTHAAQFASPTHFFPEADAEQERRLKRMEETIRALQAEAPPTLLELSTKEMARGQRFEEYATKWCARAAKHIPPISEEQQIQLFHSTLRGVYYSHLLAHTSSFSDLIEAEKKLDWGIKLGRMEDPASRGEESSKKIPATPSSFGGKRGKEVSVNVVNAAHQTPQLYSVNLTTAPTAAPAYYPPPPQNQPQPIYYSAPPVPPPATSQSYDHYAPATAQPSQPRPPVSRAPPPAQHNPTTQGSQASSTQSRPRKQYTPLPAPLSHIYRQLLANPLPGHRPSSGPSINMIVVCVSGRDEDAQDDLLPFVIDYTPGEPTVEFTGHVPSPAPFVVDIPARELYSDSKVPWTYEGKSDRGGSRSIHEDVKASEYKVVDQMAKSSAHISLLALLLGSEPHREALLRVLTSAQVPKGMPPDRIEETVGSIFSNTILFSDDELPFEGWSHSWALHIVCKCNNYIIGRVMIDNGSALNVCLVTTPETDERGPQPSPPKQNSGPSLRRLTQGSERGDRPPHRCWPMLVQHHVPGKVLLRNNYVPGTGLRERGQGISRPIEVEEYKRRRGLGFRPSCHEIIEARRGHHLHRLASYYGRLNRGSPVPPLSHFFPGPSHTIEGTLDGPSSDSDDTPAAPSVVYAVTEEHPSGVHIRLAQENEELENWTSVSRYSAVIADDHQITSVEPTEEINVGTEEEPRTLKIGTALNPTQRTRMIDFLKEYQEVFAWCYADMPGLEPSIVEHFLPLDTEKFPPKRQQLRRQRASLLLRIKEEVVKQINAGFLEVCNYSEWRLRQYTLYHTIRLLSKADPLRYLLDSPSSMTEYDIEYVPRTSVKGQAIADHLAEFPINDDTPINTDFPDEGILQVDEEKEEPTWKMYFDGAVNSVGSGVGAVLISSDGRHYPIAAKELAKNFEKISFAYTPRAKNQFADALATLASMASISEGNIIEPLEIEVAKGPTHCNAIEASEAKPWYENIRNFLQTGQYPPFADRRDRKTLRRLAMHYFLSGEILYRRSFDSTLLRCIDEHESRRLMEEVHGGNCGPHMNGLMLAKKIMRLGYYWSTMETDCVKYVRHCHRCQVYAY
ncbi:hypothetical protein CRG98_028705 [Punica granatum]|uniref:G-patch domain-containing protein n=1 Tax=Punica granatum TaxID=22663 RepID=A0A2I0J3V2_PUNGR|nr:hypothetical protein CRG98_028705 [Punica granatum]